MPLQHTYRPKTLDEMFGNDATKQSVAALLARTKDIPHAFMFYGPSGCGKTTIARIIASTLGCSTGNINEYNVANTRGIDTIREIIVNSEFSPLSGDVKVYILDECHKLTNDAQNALLKLLEDPADHSYFILCTTDPEKVIKTIHTRCHSFPLKPLPPLIMKGLLQDIVARDGAPDFPESILMAIARTCNGLPRKAVVMLDTVIDMDDEASALAAVESFSLDETKIKDICQLLVAGPSNKWKEMAGLIKKFDGEPEDARYAIMGYLQAVLLNKGDERIAEMMEFFRETFFYTKKPGLTLALYWACQR